jgi:hypothetical protein
MYEEKGRRVVNSESLVMADQKSISYLKLTGALSDSVNGVMSDVITDSSVSDKSDNNEFYSKRTSNMLSIYLLLK